MANLSGASGRLERKKTMAMNWAGLGEVEDDDDRFFESSNRISTVVPIDLASSSDEEESEFDDCRISFSSSAARPAPEPVTSPDFDIWMSAPGSITERRRRLRDGMGLESKKSMLGSISIQRISKPTAIEIVGGSVMEEKVAEEPDHNNPPPLDQRYPPMSVLIVRSRSESDIESTSAEKIRKEEMLGKTSKSRLTRTASAIGAPRARVSPPNAPKRSGAKKLSTVVSNTQFSAFFLIKNLDTGKEFIVKEYGENGAWNRLSDLQTGKQLTMEEFEKSVGFSSIVKDLMRRDNANSAIDLSKLNSYVSKSLRESKKRGAAFLKNIKGVAHSMSSKAPPEKEKEKDPNVSSLRVVDQHQQQEKNNDETNQWVKVRHSGKSHKELSALHLCQEIEAHQGAIWTMKFSPDSHLLASGGEDCAIHVWEVQECEILSTNESSLTPIQEGDDAAEVPPEKKKKGKAPSIRKGNQIPDYVHAPETVFSLSDKPICSFTGHLDDVLDLSWSRSQVSLCSFLPNIDAIIHELLFDELNHAFSCSYCFHLPRTKPCGYGISKLKAV